ncbi:NAD(P)H-binding protein [Gemella morbillorum]|uniref:NAD(P)H-binding protein n=1 Tax=Gemella morbillorum TaxID=29391 RepID=UPI0023F1852D|nr:NAD(P)H-binding protein [Gemella morbillorum]
MGNIAVIIGATGAVGREILEEVLEKEFYKKVYVLGRSSVTKLVDNEKLEKIVVDFENLEFETNILNNADVFAALGTTIKIAKTKENQRKIDLDYTINFAKICEGRVRSFNVVSAVGANRKSKSFYTSLKGELEEQLQKMNLGTLRIYRPSLLIAKRADKRMMEDFFIKISPMLKFILHGKFKKYSPIEVELLGKEMVSFAIENKGEKTYTYNDF